MSDKSAEQIRSEMEAQILAGKSFTFQSLHGRFTEPSAYRIADRLIQKLRKNGVIAFHREGRKCVWFKI